jgi:hypothetical protein
MNRFTEIVSHISFAWLDVPHEDNVSTKAGWLDYVVYSCFDFFDLKVGYGI